MERKKDITIFRIGTERVTVAEYRIRPTIGTALKHLLVGAGAIGIVWGAKQAAEIAHSVINPQYIVNGSSVPNYREEENGRIHANDLPADNVSK